MLRFATMLFVVLGLVYTCSAQSEEYYLQRREAANEAMTATNSAKSEADTAYDFMEVEKSAANEERVNALLNMGNGDVIDEGDTYRDAGNAKRTTGLQHYNDAVNNHTETTYWYNLGHNHWNQGHYGAAVAAWDFMASPAANAQSSYALSQSKFGEAEEQYEQARAIYYASYQ